MKKILKKATSKIQNNAKSQATDDEMLEEYDFSKGVRNKYHRAFRQGYTVTIRKADGTTEKQTFKPEQGAVVLDKDVSKFFPDGEAVNNALRGLIALIPSEQKKSKAA